MATSNIPSITWSNAGLVLPTESDNLNGALADINAAFGGNLNIDSLETPQGQLATSLAAVKSDKDAEILSYVNQVDPRYATGRMQDAIGYIYFLTRKAATSTIVACTLTGIPGTIIPAGTLAQDTSGNTYQLEGDVTIGSGGTITGSFANIVTGPIACPPGTLTQIYQTITGWDAVMNPAAGVLGQDEESRADFETRREQSVAGNGHGTADSVYSAIYGLDGVLDAYVIDNPASVAYFTGFISNTTLSVSSITAGRLDVNSVLTGTSVLPGTYITAKISGNGGTGTYVINQSQSVASRQLTSPAKIFGSTNYTLDAHTLYCAVSGGVDADIASAIWKKKDGGCNTQGNTTVTVIDSTNYSYPYPTYSISFNRPTALPILFEVQIVNSTLLPSNAEDLIKSAIVARFNGTDGTTRERIGSLMLTSRYYSAVASAVANVAIISILMGPTTASLTEYQVGIDNIPTISSNDITVTLV